jgi:phosphatidylglycerol---prolipoprotein diacylglyceryl transferase
MALLSYLIWSPNPDIFVIPGFGHPVRWYGLLFALGFILSQQVMLWIFKKEGKPVKHVDKLTTYMVLATVLGARLGHCLFYNPKHYLSNPIDILKVWEGGLASHGGALGILIALWLFTRKYKYTYLWILDRIVIVAALTGALIRIGNFMNSEMEGVETNSNMGVVYAGYTREYLLSDKDVEKITFKKGGDFAQDKPGYVPITAVVHYKPGVTFPQKKAKLEGITRQYLLSHPEIVQHIDFGNGQPLAYMPLDNKENLVVEIYGIGVVRHAAQLYEAFYCIVLMIVLFWLWKNKKESLPAGFNFALFMIVLWSLRFVDEFFKMSQEAYEDDMVLNMGQWLSIPLALSGVVLMWWIYKNKKSTMLDG